MKKRIILLFHILAALALAAGLGVLYAENPSGNGISWLSAQSYEESPGFAQAVNEDLAQIKKFAEYKDAFEEDGEPDMGRLVVRASTDNGQMNYTLGDMLNTAQQFGLSLDPSTHAATIDPAVSSGLDYEIKVTHKYYDPHFFEHLPQGPGQGRTSPRELSYEVALAYSRYFELRERFRDTPGNLVFFYHAMTYGGQYDDVSNTAKSDDEIVLYPKYVRAEGNTRQPETNIEPAPASVLQPMNDYSYSAVENEYLFAAGIDTAYPYRDRYRAASETFEARKRTARRSLAVCAAAGIVMLVTLAAAVVLPSDRDASDAADRLPLGALVLICAAFAALFYLLLRLTAFRAVSLVAPEQQRAYWFAAIRVLLLYFAALYLFLELADRLRRGTLLQNTFLYRAGSVLSERAKTGAPAGQLTAEYLVFLLLNLGLCLTAGFALGGGGPEGGVLARAAGFLLVLLDTGAFLVLLRRASARKRLSDALRRISEGDTGYEVPEKDFRGEQLGIAESINHISSGLKTALDEQVKAERLKADLITNVSHDIRTPLTTIINYVDLLKREDIRDGRAREYIDVLDRKSERLKKLTEDLLEASKASSGNIKMEITRLDLCEIAKQAGAEFDDRFHKRQLELCLSVPGHPVLVDADGRHLWRVLDNLYSNAAKYALAGTRVYADVLETADASVFVIKNVSQDKLNISPEELTERFVRGDVSRNSEGSGLGLSIAQSLTKLMGGELVIEIDGDLYKASVRFLRRREQTAEREKEEN